GIYGLKTPLSIPIVCSNEAASVDSKHTCHPVGDGYFQIVSLDFRDSARTIDQSASTTFERDPSNEFSVDFLDWPLQGDDIVFIHCPAPSWRGWRLDAQRPDGCGCRRTIRDERLRPSFFPAGRRPG